jgi:hypothetical protein
MLDGFDPGLKDQETGPTQLKAQLQPGGTAEATVE